MTESRILAEKAGIRTLLGKAFEYQQTVPFFWLFTATLHADPPVGDAEALRRLGSSADLRYWVVHDLHRAIRAAAAKTPLLILLEDIHWADTGTLLALQALQATPHDSPVLWVLSARTGAGGPAVRNTVGELERQGAAFVRLSAMPRSGVIDMVEDAVRARADVSLLNLADKAHGNPFLVTELLGGLNEESRLRFSGGCAVATGETLPSRLSANMRQRLDAHCPMWRGKSSRWLRYCPTCSLPPYSRKCWNGNLRSWYLPLRRRCVLTCSSTMATTLDSATTYYEKRHGNRCHHPCSARLSANRQTSCSRWAPRRRQWQRSWREAPTWATRRLSQPYTRPLNPWLTVTRAVPPI